MKLVHFSKHFAENYMMNIKFNPKMDTIRTFFFPNQGTFFFFKKEQKRPPPSYSPLLHAS